MPACNRITRLSVVLFALLLSACSDDDTNGGVANNTQAGAGNTGGVAGSEGTGNTGGSVGNEGVGNGGTDNNGTPPVNTGGNTGNELPVQGPLTAPPGIDDEPELEPSEFNNAVGFDVYRDTQPSIPFIAPETSSADEAEFSQGLPDVVVSAPEGLDTSSNQAPFFSDLQNLDVFAGELISIRLKPEDADGGVPGMFIDFSPEGATFPDNRDGSKTFTWQPLQEDVGVFRLTVVAVDPENSLYRSAQAILIRISMPDDPSSIPNRAPTLQMPGSYTVRANDPVVMSLKGQDLNGTIPTLEIPDLPAGASFVPHPRFAGVFVFKFTPRVAGNFTFEVLARDSVDTTLTSTNSVTISVLDEQAFQIAGLSLKQRAASVGKKIGFAAKQSFYNLPDGVIYAEIAAREFDIVTPENSMKMDTINPLPGRYDFAGTDNLIRFAKLHGMSVHGHPLVWHRLLPEWVINTDVEEREGHMLEYIDRMMSRYSDDVSVWDVVNEPVNDDGSMRDSIWFEAMEERYIDKALNRARQLSPSATLLINEFDINEAGPKFDGLLALIQRLQQRQVALDGIGFQMHVFSDFSTFDELQANFETIANLGLEIYISELDVSIAGEKTPQALQQQADTYRRIAALCVEQPACKAIQMWGFTDNYSFRANFDPLPFDRAYQAKPAYQALHDAFSGTNTP